ncbi:SLC13 family permease [Desulfovibrio desulfuricans]|uniref:SLC13 family permease n=1 Tax=Desulfovibrio desulfuricans TaxID=876 RepID=UPI0003B411F8|nr:SLC13 family permease [Desulfovibrio desulfuricans]
MAEIAAENKGNLVKNIRLAGSVLSIILGIWVALQAPPEGLNEKTMIALGITVWAVGWWITEIVPEFVTGLMMCILWSAFKCVPFKTAFATFSTSGWWIMVGAFALGAVAGKTGLLKRISLWVLKLFPASFAGQVWGLIGSGTVIGPLIPSMNAKATLSSPIAMGISDELGIERKSNAANGLFGACYVGFILMGHMFMSGSFSHYVLVGMLPEAYRGVTWLQWLLWSLPYGVCVFLGMGLFIVTCYKPKEKVSLPAGYSTAQLEKLGPMTRNEKLCMGVLIVTLLMWMTESLHKISAGEVSLMAMCTLMLLKVMDKNDFKTGIDWSSVVFVGSILNMASVIQSLKVDRWLGTELQPLLANVISEPALFIVTLVVVASLVKLVIVSLTSASAIFVLILPPIMIAHGMNPWIACMVTFAGSDIWYLSYMNSIYLCAHFGTQGKMARHGAMIKLSAAYTAICIVAFLISIPYWKMLGLIK